MAAPVETSQQYEERLQKLIKAYGQRVQGVYGKAITDVSIYAKAINEFNPEASPALKTMMEGTLQKMARGVEVLLTTSIQQAWELANNKNNVLMKQLHRSQQSPAVKEAMFSKNLEAQDKFLKRKDEGLSLSDRIWQNVEPYKHELEAGLTAGIGKGQSAAKTATLLKKNLLKPDNLFRKVRDDKGKLQLSKAARNYKPGAGVYRSSFQNAFRLTRTETNMAYRTSDHERWLKDDTITGKEIRISNNHPVYDICDAMQGIYPKDFKFEGWHPNCRCVAIPILATQAQREALDDVMLGLSDKDPGIKYHEDIPAQATKWISKNLERIDGWANKPYWYKNNPSFIKQITQPGFVKAPFKPLFKAPAKPVVKPKAPPVVKQPPVELPPVLKPLVPVEPDKAVLLGDHLFNSSYETVVSGDFTYKGTEITDLEKAAIFTYSRSGYIDLNMYQRGRLDHATDTKKRFLDNFTTVLESGLKKLHTTFQGLTYRGTSLPPEVRAKIKKLFKEGKAYSEPAFLSSTYKAGNAFSGNDVFFITSKTGKNIETLSNIDTEREVLYNRNVQFRITNIESNAGKNTYYLEEI